MADPITDAAAAVRDAFRSRNDLVALAAKDTAAASLDAPRIRDAREDDLPAILEILNHAILTSTASWSESPKTISDIAAWFAARRGAGHPVIVAEIGGGGVVGYAACGPFRASGSAAPGGPGWRRGDCLALGGHGHLRPCLERLDDLLLGLDALIAHRPREG